LDVATDTKREQKRTGRARQNFLQHVCCRGHLA
jgi:hypothetical protein